MKTLIKNVYVNQTLVNILIEDGKIAAINLSLIHI